MGNLCEKLTLFKEQSSDQAENEQQLPPTVERISLDCKKTEAPPIFLQDSYRNDERKG